MSCPKIVLVQWGDQRLKSVLRHGCRSWVISSIRRSKLTLSCLHDRHCLSTTRSDQTLRFKHLAYIREAVMGAGDRGLITVVAGWWVPLARSSWRFIICSVLLPVYLDLLYVLVLCGLLTVMAQMRWVAARNNGWVLRAHLRLVSVNVSPAIGCVWTGVGGRVAGCVRCARVAALLPVLVIGGVVQPVRILVNGARRNCREGRWSGGLWQL